MPVWETLCPTCASCGRAMPSPLDWSVANCASCRNYLHEFWCFIEHGTGRRKSARSLGMRIGTPHFETFMLELRGPQAISLMAHAIEVYLEEITP